MQYSYNKLWKILVDHNMTKTEMRKQAGISTNTLAEMGKGLPIATKDLAKICTALQCSQVDIVEVSEDKMSAHSEAMEYSISKATARNWKKLNSKSTGRLTKRANKRNSKRRIFPFEYICNKNNISFVQNTIDYIDENGIDIISAIFSLGISLLKQAKIYEKWHVAKVLNEYSDVAIIEELSSTRLPNDEFDILGVIYQSYLYEGKKT